MSDKNLETLEARLAKDIDATQTHEQLDAVRIAALGKKGSISQQLKTLGALDPETRKTEGARINGVKTRITAHIATRKSALDAEALAARLAEERVDITQPPPPDPLMQGRLHPISQTTEELVAIFADMGFDIADGPDIETDYYNFTALNIPESHPARQMHDTFYFEPDADGTRRLLRTHTSPVQIRAMQNAKPPFRLIAPGRTYRCDSDQTHTPMFHQLEGLVVDEETHMGHLRATLEALLAAFFEVENIAIRLRPSYFPFTEPSMEVDMQCHRDGDQIIAGQGDEWLELGGSGMVHSRVLQEVGLDPARYQGFAFGMGIDRLAMLKYGMPDLRAFFDADLRWLAHYGFKPLDVPTLARGLANAMSYPTGS